MQIFFLAFTTLLIITAIMAVGVIMGRKPISGSCGGVGTALGEEDYVCDLCGGDEARCDELKVQAVKASSPSDFFYRADK